MCNHCSVCNFYQAQLKTNWIWNEGSKYYASWFIRHNNFPRCSDAKFPADNLIKEHLHTNEAIRPLQNGIPSVIRVPTKISLFLHLSHPLPNVLGRDIVHQYVNAMCNHNLE